MLANYTVLVVLLAVSTLVPVGALVTARIIRPHKPNPIKSETYECGVETIGETWVQFKVQYYIYALVFIVFDVETAFLYPWAVAYKRLGLFALFEMLVFIAVLLAGLLYAWRKGALDWV